MATLTVSNNQLRLIQNALDFYSRVGIGQMNVIKDHPTYEGVLREKLRPKKTIEVGDRTEQGEVIKITKNRIQTKGWWNTKEELRWFPRDQVKLSIDYGQFHSIRDAGERQLNVGRNMLLQEEIHNNGSYGIHNPNVDESCRIAFDIIQVIRHEFWKADEDRKDYTVDSSVHLSTKDSNRIKVELDPTHRDMLNLSNRDVIELIKAITNSPLPNDTLLKAFKEYEQKLNAD